MGLEQRIWALDEMEVPQKRRRDSCLVGAVTRMRGGGDVVSQVDERAWCVAKCGAEMGVTMILGLSHGKAFPIRIKPVSWPTL